MQQVNPGSWQHPPYVLQPSARVHLRVSRQLNQLVEKARPWHAGEAVASSRANGMYLELQHCGGAKPWLIEMTWIR